MVFVGLGVPSGSIRGAMMSCALEQKEWGLYNPGGSGKGVDEYTLK